MKQLTSVIILLLIFSFPAISQVGINNDGSQPTSHSILDVKSETQGMLIPRMTTTQRNTLATQLNTDHKGMMVFDVTSNFLLLWTGIAFEAVNESSNSEIIDNDGDTYVNVESAADDDEIVFSTGGNVYWTFKNGRIETVNTGYSVFMGEKAGENDDLSNNNNVFVGYKSGQDNSTGNSNVAVGFESLENNTSSSNTAIGNNALNNSTSGGVNTAVGASSMISNTSGYSNTAIGAYSLYLNNTGLYNTGLGYRTNFSNEDGDANTIIGYEAGMGSSAHNKFRNIFIGFRAGYNETGNDKLYIENSDSEYPLIGGDFSTDQVDINGTIKITGGTPGNGKVLTSDADGLASWTDGPGAKEIDDLSDAINNGASLFLGTDAGQNDDGLNNNNTSVGNSSALSNTSGSHNSFFGMLSGYKNTTGHYNSFFGYVSGKENTTGQDNVGFGRSTLLNNSTGNFNTAIGNLAGIGNNDNSFSGCVMLGYSAGRHNTSDNKLYIDNSDTPGPLIGGDFSTNQVDINGTIKITGGTPGDGKVLTSDAYGLASWEDNLGATELNDLSDARTSSNSVFIGDDSGLSNSGDFNTALGYRTLNNNTSGEWNTVVGSNSAIQSNGDRNSIFGTNNFNNNTSGSYNTAVGTDVQYYNTTGGSNVAIGSFSLYFNSTGSNNIAIGKSAGYGSSGTSYSGCIFIGNSAGSLNTTDNKLYIDNSSTSSPLIGGDFDANQVDINGTIKITGGTPGDDKVLTSDADGLGTWRTPTTYASDINDLSDAVYNGSDLFLGNGTGDNNSGTNSNLAVGINALTSNTTSDFNTAVGIQTLQLTTGQRNTAIGYFSMRDNTNGSFNTSLGYRTGYDNITGSYNTFIGYNARMTNSTARQNSTAIGNDAVITASNQVRIGNGFVTSIGGYTAWTSLSDGRFKENIKEDVAGLEFILNLRPVSYNVNKQAFNAFVGSEYQSNNKTSSRRECGFVAQEVEELIQKTGVEFNGVDAPENGNDYYGIRYSQFVVPLVVGMQEQQQQIENLEKEKAELKTQNAEMLKRIEKLEEILLKK